MKRVGRGRLLSGRDGGVEERVKACRLSPEDVPVSSPYTAGWKNLGLYTDET